MFDLQPYAFEILCAYGIALFLLGWIIGQSLWQARKTHRELKAYQKAWQAKKADRTDKNP